MEAECEERQNERDGQFMATVTSMMTMMRQQMVAEFYPPVPMPLMTPLCGPSQATEDPESEDDS